MVKTPLSGMSVMSTMKGLKSPPLAQIFSPSAAYFSDKKEQAELTGNQDFRYNVLEPNGMIVADHHMLDEDWSRIAFSLGIPMRQSAKHTADSKRLAYRMRKRKHVSDSQTVQNLSTFVDSLNDSLDLSQADTSEFCMDAVPTIDVLKNSIHRVPKPIPSISIGYTPRSFSHLDEELQRGIIANEGGYPVDLGKVSQPIPGHYWPFLVVEVTEHSMNAAKNACAISASSCNNAVRMLSHASRSDYGRDPDKNPFNSSDLNTRNCFSLAVSGKLASLNVHDSDKQGHHILRTIMTYCLDEDNDVASLGERLRSIMVWGRFSRLPEISEKLEAFNRKVNGVSPPCHQLEYKHDDFDPSLLKTLNIRASKSRKKKAVLQMGLPGWVVK